MELTLDELTIIVDAAARPLGLRAKEVFVKPETVKLLASAGAEVVTNKVMPGDSWVTTVRVGKVLFTHHSIGVILQ